MGETGNTGEAVRFGGRVYSLIVDGVKRLSTVDGKTAFVVAEKEAAAGHSILVKAENAKSGGEEK